MLNWSAMPGRGAEPLTSTWHVLRTNLKKHLLRMHLLRTAVECAVLIMSGCGGVADHFLPRIDVRGEVVGIRATGPEQSILLGSASDSAAIKTCEEDFRAGRSGRPDVCSGRKAVAGLDGRFQVELAGSGRGCPFLIIPPLLDTLCDDKSYVVLALPTEPVEIYLITISAKGDQARISGPYPHSGRYAGQRLKIIGSRRIDNEPSAVLKIRQSLDLQIDLR